MKQKTTNVKVSQILKQIWLAIKPTKVSFIISCSLFFVSQIISIFVPLLYKKFFDTLGQGGDRNILVPVLIKIIVIVAIIKLANWLFWRIAIYIYNKMESKVIAKLKQNSFDYMIKHSYNFFTNNFSGSLVQRVNRFSRAFEALSDSIIFDIMPLFITIIGSVIITWFVAPIISILIVSWVIIFVIFNVSFSLWKLKYDIAVAEADSKTTGYLADSITNNNAVSLFTGGEFESTAFKDITNEQARKTRFSWYLADVVDGTMAFLIVIVEFFIFYYTIKYWGQGLTTVGTFVLAQTYIIGVAQQLRQLNRVIRNIYESLADSKEMVEILLTPYEIKDIPNAQKIKVTAGKIIFDNVDFTFSKDREVITDLNLTIETGQKIAIVGPSGAGKTTFVRLIMRLYDLTKGQILIDNQDISKVTQDSLRENISLVPQDPVLFHRTLMENIRYGRRDATDDEVKEAARLAHCDEFIEKLPLKYETFVGERGIKLSGGERQRVAIARAILKHAPILILDEATSSLDSHSEALIQDALDNLMKNCTTIVIAHRLSTIRKMDRIIAMKDGKIVEDGTHDELSNKDSGLYKDLWELQAGGFIHK
jgi:ATP-binding cassette subfamily B protein